MVMLRQLLHIMAGLAITLPGLGLCFAFGVFSFIGIPLVAIGLGVLSTAIDRVDPQSSGL
jgi:formate hydrogenlyase subunit 3/multisubunit Na+/H+ antiporter MnhD subunit